MQNSARIQSLVQQLVDALVDEITAEVRMRTGASVGSAAAPASQPLPSFDQMEKLPAWDDLPSQPSAQPQQPEIAPTPKFETPDFDQLLRDLEELRKPLESKPAPVQDAEVVPNSVSNTQIGSTAQDTSAPGGSKPFSGLSGASDLLKRVTGK